MSERTEKPTPKRREDARRKGQIARSPKLASAVGFLVAFGIFRVTAQDWLHRVEYLLVSLVPSLKATTPLTLQSVHQLFIQAILVIALPVLIVTIAIAIASLAAYVFQGGIVLSTHGLESGSERLNPVSNFKKIFSPQTAVESLKSILELIALIWVCYGVMIQAIVDAPTFIGAPVMVTLATLSSLLNSLGLRVGGVLLISSALDYGYKWYSLEKSLRMSKQEIKQEFRDQEGDPMVKGQRRRAARAMLQRRNLAQVATADVVITNPTHFAIAIQYDQNQFAAPIVVAKGVDFVAMRIRELAFESNIEIVENPPLARALYVAVEPGQMIPPEFFRAVAEVLAYIYRKNGKQPER